MKPRNLWYKSAIIYELDVRTFYDSNGDGWGDFEGLIEKLDHITSLGATCIWLKPFNSSPHRDGGYDITDYYSMDPRIGTLGDFVEFMEEAASRGLAVITELVAGHTSSKHPRTRHIRFNDLEEPEPVPRDTDYSSVIVSDQPVVVQHTRLDSRQPANALLSTIGYPVQPGP